MVEASTIELMAQLTCSISLVAFTFIATFSRNAKLELKVQNFIMFTLMLSAILLWWLHFAGGTLWGSNYLPLPLSVVCVIIALSARMNIKGENVSFGANPHNISKILEEE
ncbi:MAG TPA: hypothetical protein EYQ73_03640 [Candidatus Poseidoniales archaeon]|jgi:hypothetical protein|nr:MAG: hypothetical protein CXT71_06300 [Euryarchaeota archaeon]HIF45873.1 hypothetical protein [Candidatus Poseidoniales archaeon]HIL65018.1 hypothetical protein [Candidatus Poseidoniales archaeon]